MSLSILSLLLAAAPLLAQAPDTAAAAPPATEAGAGGAGAAAAPKRKGPDVSKMPFNQESVRAIVTAHLDEIQSCYEESMAQRGHTGRNAPGGRVLMGWTITEDGIVVDVTVKKSAIKDALVLDCMSLAIRSWEFPKAPRRQPVQLPFDLKPVSGVQVPGPADASKTKGKAKGR